MPQSKYGETEKSNIIYFQETNWKIRPCRLYNNIDARTRLPIPSNRQAWKSMIDYSSRNGSTSWTKFIIDED